MRVLVVDHNAQSRQQTVITLSNGGHEVAETCSPLDTLALLASQSVDLILMDEKLPGMFGTELIRMIRSRIEQWIPVIYLSNSDDEALLADAISSGADDYLSKPVSPLLLNAKLNAFERISLMQRELDNSNRELEQLSCEDPLTQLQNRRGLEKGLQDAWRSHGKTGAELSVMMIDIDHFKAYNDNYGHAQGDKCLQQIASLLKRPLTAKEDILARFGGEEFIAVLPHTPLESAKLIADRIMHIIKQTGLQHEYSPTAATVTASIGIASTSHAAESVHKLIEQADQAMYAAKQYGRNQKLSFCQIDQLIKTASSRPAVVG